jgi:SOS-response transcriptional repressor LexA
MNETRRRSLEALITKYGSQAALSEKTGIAPAQLSQIITGRRNVGEKFARKLEEKLNLPMRWMDIEENQRKQRDHLKEDALSQPSVGAEVQIMGYVPLISWVQAGSWHEAIDNFAPGDSEDQLPCPVPHGPNTFAVQVSGDSMADKYPEGYIIFVDPNVQATHRDDVVVRLLPDNEVTFKRYMVDGSKPYLKAMNKNWPNPIIPINGDAEICGVVIFAGMYPQKSD